MGQNPIEDNPVTRFLLGFAVVVAMMLGGQVGGSLFGAVAFPYATWVGVLVGATVVFAGFVILYRRYDRAHSDGS